MLYSEVKTMIDEIGLPSAYYAFPDGTAQEPPFVVFYYAYSDDLFADNSNYRGISNLTVELYTDHKDPLEEAIVENVLRSHGITWAKSEAVIEAELMTQVTYATEVLLEPETIPSEDLNNAED